MTEKEWLHERTKGIGGSDVGAILGKSTFSTPLQIWEAKRGAISPDTADTKRGHLLEDLVASQFSDETGYPVRRSDVSIYTDPEVPYFKASIDRFYETPTGVGVLECKTTRLKITEDTIPEKWLYQLQWYLGISGLAYGAIAWLNPFYDVLYKYYERDDALIAELRERMHAFWHNHVVAGVPPAPFTSQEIVSVAPSAKAGSVVSVTQELYDKVLELSKVKAEIKQLEEKEDKLAFDVKLALKEAEAMSFNEETVATFKQNKDSEELDVARIKKERPDIWQEFKKPKRGARILKLYV